VLWWKFLFLSIEGRIGRKAFWIGYGVLFAVFVVFYGLMWLAGVADFSGAAAKQDLPPLEDKSYILSFLFGLVVLYPTLAVYVKRLHDLGRSGWWAVAILAIGYLLNFGLLLGYFGTVHHLNGAGWIWMAFNMTLSIALFIYLGVVRGDRGDNIYGAPDPLSAAAWDDGAPGGGGWWNLMFGFRGRVARSGYWIGFGSAFGIFMLFAMVAGGVLMAAVVPALNEVGLSMEQMDTPEANAIVRRVMNDGSIGLIIYSIYSVGLLLFFYNMFAVSFKRLRDRGRSGWLLAAAVGLLFFFFTAPIFLSRMADMAVGVLTLAFYLWLFVEAAMLRGATGPNRYGEDPLRKGGGIGG